MPGRIEIDLPQGRSAAGTLTLRSSSGAVVFGPVSAGGVSDNAAAVANGNPQRSTILPFGDTPTGAYSIEKTVPTGPGTSRSASSYGQNGGIVLVPTSGDALLASRAGRTGLMIHGGAPSASGGLRPTHGCVRLSDRDMGGLMASVTVLMATEAPPDACAVSEFPTVAIPDGATIDANAPANADESDPPPQDGAAPPILP
jgi:hypothetical protein